jgi:hypothetical protein
MHQAIQAVLQERRGQQAHSVEIAEAINRARLYLRRDGLPLWPCPGSPDTLLS